MHDVLPADARAALMEAASDRTSGAREIAARALNATMTALHGAADPEETILAAAAIVVPAQPTLAALLAGFDRLFRAADRGGVPAALAEAERQLGEQRRDLARIADHAVEVLRPCASAAMLSWSSTVAAVLDRAGLGLTRIVVAESRPGGEGRRAAAHAASTGRRVEFATDAAFPALAAGTDALLLGGDALLPRGLLNKVGSRSAAREVRGAGRPVYAFLEDLKIVGGALAERVRVLSEPPREVWDGAPAGVVVRNERFELVPAELLTAVVTAVGAESPAAAIDRAGPDSPHPLWLRVPAPSEGRLP